MPALRRICYKGFRSIGGLCCLVSAGKVPFQKYHLVPQISGTIIGGASCSGGKLESLFSHVSMRNISSFHNATHAACVSEGLCPYRLSS